MPHEEKIALLSEPSTLHMSTPRSGTTTASDFDSRTFNTPSDCQETKLSTVSSTKPSDHDHHGVPFSSEDGKYPDDSYLYVGPEPTDSYERMSFMDKFIHDTKMLAKRVWGRKLRTVFLFFMLIIPAIAFALEEEQGGSGHGGEASSEMLIPVVQGQLTANQFVNISSNFEYRYAEVSATYNTDGDLIMPNLTVQLSDCEREPTFIEDWRLEGNPRPGLGSTFTHVFKGCVDSDCFQLKGCKFSVTMDDSEEVFDPVAISFQFHGVSTLVDYEVLFGGLILAFVYFLIITELIHRTLAAMLGSFITLGVLSALNKRPALSVIVGWIDFETVMLLFGMMIIVGVLAETGVFEYAAVKAYKYSRGQVWPLLTMLISFSAVVSAFLDNVTTILLLTPVTIRMCNVIGLDPTPILLAEVVFSNIGGTATAVGDPPNVIIVSSKWSEVPGEDDIEFTELTVHLFCGIFFVVIACYFQLRFMYRNTIFNNPDSPRVAELKREIAIWQRTLKKQPSTTRQEKEFCAKLMSYIEERQVLIKEALSSDQESWAETVREMELDAQIKNFDLFYNTVLVLVVVILLFFLHSIPSIHLDLGWIAVLGALALLLISGIQNIEELMMKVEWATLLFFGALFILMEGLGELGLISAIGDATSNMIRGFDPDTRLAWSIVLVLWVSAIASSFIDNIPFTAAMIPVIKTIASDPDVGIPLRPLVWSLAFGACLGGNGTLIGASANVVMAGLAEQEGISITFNRFFKLGFPIMLVSTFVAMLYLLLCHVAFSWGH
eukprot:m.595543 g.595543  ORF g.595543 m.595543 type:complete len:777 (-) comp22405_c0_seq2:195-2525(-)